MNTPKDDAARIAELTAELIAEGYWSKKEAAAVATWIVREAKSAPPMTEERARRILGIVEIHASGSG